MLSIYKASAGSGKTHTLTGEYLHMLFRDFQSNRETMMPHSHILAVTFTKKATAEMKERILKALFVLSKNPKESPYYQSITNTFNLDAKTIQEQSRQLLIGILQDFSRFSVSTIDGFFQQVVRTFAMELGLSTTYDLALDNDEVIQQAVDDVFRKIRSNEAENEEIISWVTAFAEHNIEENQKWNPYQSVSTFSKELKKEKLKRNLADVRTFFANKNNIITYRKELENTIHNVIVKTEAILQIGQKVTEGVEGLKKAAISVFEKSAESFLKDGLGKTIWKVLNQTEEIYTKSKTTKAQQEFLVDLYHTKLLPLYQQLIDILDNDRIDYYTARAILKHLYAIGLIQDVAGQAEQTNRETGRLPLADINLLIHEVIDGQDTPFIYERLGQYFRHFMIDEFQDTSALQWQNFEPLIQEAESNNNDNLVVGDVKQSIYRWRNSDWRLLNQVDQSFGNTQLPKMDSNWRTAELLVKHNEQLMLQYSQWIYQVLQHEGWDQSIDVQSIKQIYAQDAIHQEAKQSIPGIIHLQFFEGGKNDVVMSCLSALGNQLKQLQAEQIDLGRVALLVRKKEEAEIVAKYLIEQGYAVQSSEGMRVHSHPAVKLLVAIMQQEVNRQQQITDDVTNAIIQELHIPFTESEQTAIEHAAKLPLYEYVQKMIELLHLEEEDGSLPYLTAFQDQIYQFTQSRVSDVKLFLEYWERKKGKVSIPAPAVNNAIRIMTIHSSKGLEFDIVMLPLFWWNLKDSDFSNRNNFLWCKPKTEPFNQMPIVAVSLTKDILNTHFCNEYIQEITSQYIDYLNLTYVALTRPKYRLYAYGPRFEDIEKPTSKITNVGQLFSSLLYQTKETDNQGEETISLQQLEDGSWCYHKEDPNPVLTPQEKANDNTRQATYVCSPIEGRLTLRSRAEDDFEEDTPLETVDLGILMHEWLAEIITWADAQRTLEKLRIIGRITEAQGEQLEAQWQQLRTLLQRENKNHWFDGSMQVLTEQTILSTNGKTYRPDRIVICEKHAEVIDYKFGNEHIDRYNEQLRNYTLMLQQMGYTVDAYIVYAALQKITKVH